MTAVMLIARKLKPLRIEMNLKWPFFVRITSESCMECVHVIGHSESINSTQSIKFIAIYTSCGCNFPMKWILNVCWGLRASLGKFAKPAEKMIEIWMCLCLQFRHVDINFYETTKYAGRIRRINSNNKSFITEKKANKNVIFIGNTSSWMMSNRTFDSTKETVVNI